MPARVIVYRQNSLARALDTKVGSSAIHGSGERESVVCLVTRGETNACLMHANAGYACLAHTTDGFVWPPDMGHSTINTQGLPVNFHDHYVSIRTPLNAQDGTPNCMV